MTVKELYYSTNLIGPILLSCARTDIFGDDSVDEKIYPSSNELRCDFGSIGDFRITHMQAIQGRLTLTIEKTPIEKTPKHNF